MDISRLGSPAQTTRAQQGARPAPPPMTDAMAAKMGEEIRKQSPDLFNALDTDHTGTLTAAKLEVGKDTVLTAIRNGTLAPPQGPGKDQGASATDSASFSPEGMAALAQSDGGTPASQVGGRQDAGTGKDTAAKAAHGPPPGGGAGAATGTTGTTDETTKTINTLHKQGLSNAEIAARLGKTEAQVKQALTSA